MAEELRHDDRERVAARDALLVAEQSLVESERWFEQLVANSKDLIAVIDEHATLIYANPSSATLMGYEKGSKTGQTIFDLIHPDDHAGATAALAEIITQPGTSNPVVLRILTSTNEWRFIEVELTNCLEDPAIQGVVANGRDVTDRTYRGRALQALTDGHKVLGKATKESSLLADICTTLVAEPSILLAWIGYVEDDDDAFVRPVASAGRTGFLNEATTRWNSAEFADGLIGKVVHTKSPQVVEDVREATDLTGWWAQAEQYELFSACSFPLLIGADAVGTLTIHSDEVGFFGVDEVKLFGDLAVELSYGVGRLRDAQRLVRHERLLRASEERFRLAFEVNAAPMVFSDLDDRVIAVNNAFCRMIGYSPEELLGRDSKQFTFPDDVGITEDSLERLTTNEVDQDRYVKRYLRPDGRMVVSEVSRSPARDVDGQILYFVASERDVTEERALASQLSFQASHDPLTGLANRTFFADRLLKAHDAVRRNGGVGAIFLLDLDDFKGVNDTYGHLAGDELLVDFTHRLAAMSRPSDTLCRFGGDEFLYLAEGLIDVVDVELVAQRILDALIEPFTVAERRYTQRVSIGVVVWDGTESALDGFLRDADIALYEAKRRGKARFVVFSPLMGEQFAYRFEMTRELRESLANGELTIQYQPIVDLESMAVVGFESLIRWHHPTRGWIEPEMFIPLAEESDLIFEIGAFALREAIREASTWESRDPTLSAPFVTVNMSARHFLDPAFLSSMEEELRRVHLSPERLIIEITEGVALLDVADTMHVVDELRRMNVGIALDDFGTGYSSFSYLTSLNPKIVKIDKSLVSPELENSKSDTLLEAIIALGTKLNMTIIAEGIETPAKLDHLRGLGCQWGQGYLFSHSVAASEVASLLARDTQSVDALRSHPKTPLV